MAKIKKIQVKKISQSQKEEKPEEKLQPPKKEKPEVTAGEQSEIEVTENLEVKLFEEIEILLKTKMCSKYGLFTLRPNNGNKLNICQGSRSNVWGFIEAKYVNGEFHHFHVIIYTVLLKKLLSTNKYIKKTLEPALL